MSEKITATVTAPCGHLLDVAVNRQTGLRRALHVFDPITRTCRADKRRYRLQVTVRPNKWPDGDWYAINSVVDITEYPATELTIVTAERVDRFGTSI